MSMRMYKEYLEDVGEEHMSTRAMEETYRRSRTVESEDGGGDRAKDNGPIIGGQDNLPI